MKQINSNTIPDTQIHQYILPDRGEFPNNILPVIHYRQVLHLPLFFSSQSVKEQLQENDWGNNWRGGIFTYHHYHSNTHEALAVIKGRTRLLLGGDGGELIRIEKGDLLIIPAGVAHKNLGKETDVTCIAGYPGGVNYDLKYGKTDERPAVDQQIEEVKIPVTGPLFGKRDPLPMLWGRVARVIPMGLV